MTAIHVGFDMGIRNLAYCMIAHGASDATWTVEAWDNIDLLEGGTTAQDAKRCVACTNPAKWFGEGVKWCQACATGVRRKKTATRRPSLPTLSCATSVLALRKLATEQGMLDARKATKPELLTWLSSRFLMPWKPAKTMDASLHTIYVAMNAWLSTVLPTFAHATLIRLENQPVMKGPTMKSVQIMLYTLLLHRLATEHGWNGTIEFVHAGTKTRGKIDAAAATTDAAAYATRKRTAESEVHELLTARGVTCASWLTFFAGRSKKSDLADAFLMAHRRTQPRSSS